jgi:hypothetical protein
MVGQGRKWVQSTRLVNLRRPLSLRDPQLEASDLSGAQKAARRLPHTSTGNRVLGTDAIRTRARVSALSCCDAYRAACVLVVIRLARIAESTLTRHMSGGLALGTDAGRTRDRLAVVSWRAAYRAILWAILVSCHMCGTATVIADRVSMSTFLSLSFLPAAAVTDPADDLPAVRIAAVSRDPADGLSAAFLRPRCWTPDGRTWREPGGMRSDRPQIFVCFNGGTPVENDDQFSLPWTEYYRDRILPVVCE